jgi:hypothetical protein
MSNASVEADESPDRALDCTEAPGIIAQDHHNQCRLFVGHAGI